MGWGAGIQGGERKGLPRPQKRTFKLDYGTQGGLVGSLLRSINEHAESSTLLWQMV